MAISRFLEGLSEYISGLDTDKQERIARSLVRRAINEDIDLSRSYDLFTKQGFNIPQDRFSDIYTNVEQRELNSQRVKFLNKNQTPSENILYPSFTLEASRYKFGFEYDFYDETDDQYHKKFFFIESNKLQTREQLETLATEIIHGIYGKELTDIGEAKLRYGEINVRSIR